MLKKSNPEENDDINRKIIDVLHTEIRRLSEKGREIDQNFHPAATHPQPNTTLNAIPRNPKAELIFTRIANSQNKIDTITTPDDQANTDESNSSTAGSTAFIQENSQDVSSHMSTNETETGCNESSLVINPPGISHQTIRFDDTSLTLGDVTNDVEQKLQKIASVISEACRIIVFVNAEISTNCDISVSTDLYF